MARLVLAVLVLSGLIALLALVAAGWRAVRGDAGADDAPSQGESVQKLSFALLMALILYVSVFGGSG